MPQVSVIIPTHNRAEFLRLAISSVLNQTFQDFEIIVIDDASQDNTAAVVNDFGDGRIKYHRHATGKGGAAARNTGILHSQAEVIAFLDDDDEWLPDKLQTQFALLQSCSPKVGLVYSGYLIVKKSNGKIIGKRVPSRRGDLSKAMLVENHIGGTTSVMIRRTCFEAVGLFDESLTSYQDYDLWIRLASHFQFDYIREPLHKYFVHQNQIWTNLPALSHGVEIVLQKHGHSASFRKYMSYRCLSLGGKYCQMGDSANARRTFSKAIRLFPFEIRHYLNLGLSLFGAERFCKMKAIKDRILFSVLSKKVTTPLGS